MAASSIAVRAALGLLSDERLAARAAQGEREAVAVLFRRHHQSVYRYCLAILRNAEDAADVLQTTMLKALQTLDSGRKDLAVRPWLFRVAHNEAISLLRQRGRHVGLSDEMASAGAVEEASETRRRLAGVLDDLAELPERQRGALVMRELEGVSYEQIAAALGTSPAAAKQTVYEARIALAEMERGRDLSCETVTERISERDGRVLRGRAMQAHLRRCDRCRDFRASVSLRKTGLAALPGLSPEQAASILRALLGGGGPGAGTAVAVISGGAKLAAASLAAKAAAPAAVAVALAVSAGGGASTVPTRADGSGAAVAPTAGPPETAEPSARPVAPPAERRAEPTADETGASAAGPERGIDASGGSTVDAPAAAEPGPVSEPSRGPAPAGESGGATAGAGTWDGTPSQLSEPSQASDPSRTDWGTPTAPSARSSESQPPSTNPLAPAPTTPTDTVPSAPPALSVVSLHSLGETAASDSGSSATGGG